MKKTDWKKPTTIAVLVFIAVFIFFLANESKADTNIELVPGYTFAGGKKYNGTGALLTERFNNKYDVGFTLIASQSCDCRFGDYSSNLGVQAQRVVLWNNFEIGLGVAYWNNQTPALGSNTTFSLSAGYNFNNGVGIKWRHYSTGGSSPSNQGLDMVTIGYRF